MCLQKRKQTILTKASRVNQQFEKSIMFAFSVAMSKCKPMNKMTKIK